LNPQKNCVGVFKAGEVPRVNVEERRWKEVCHGEKVQYQKTTVLGEQPFDGHCGLR
jgi:hypothetical protein